MCFCGPFKEWQLKSWARWDASDDNDVHVDNVMTMTVSTRAGDSIWIKWGGQQRIPRSVWPLPNIYPFPPPSKSLNAAFVLVSVPNTAVSQCCQQSVKSSQLNGQSGPRKHIKIYKISDRITMPLRNPKCDITENFGAIFLRGSMSHTVDSRNWLPWKCTVFLKSAFNFNFSDLLKKRQNDSTVMSHCI